MIPNQSHAINGGGPIDPVWLRWLAQLEQDAQSSASDIAAIATALGSPDGTVANIPAQGSSAAATIRGFGPIQVTGSLAEGNVSINGRPLNDIGEGTFKLLTRDSYGRLSGTADGSAADVPYDNTASGLGAGDVQAAVDELSSEKLDDAPSNGNEYVRKNGAWSVASGGGSAFDPSTQAVIVPFDDFTTFPNGTSFPLKTEVALTGGVSGVDGGATTPGVCRLSTGTNSLGRAAIKCGDTNNITVGGGEIEIATRFRIPTLSDGTNTFFCQLAGLLNAWDATATNRIYAAYPSAGGGLSLICRNAGVDTSDDGSTVLVANTWYRLRLVVNAAGTEANLYVDDVLEATVSSGLPTAALRAGTLIGKSAGTTSRDLDLDYLYANQVLTTAR